MTFFVYCCNSRTEQLVHDIDPEVVKAALKDFLQELKDTQRDKESARAEVTNSMRQVFVYFKIHLFYVAPDSFNIIVKAIPSLKFTILKLRSNELRMSLWIKSF